MLGTCNSYVRLQSRVTSSGITVDSLTIFFFPFFLFFLGGGQGAGGTSNEIGFFMGIGVVNVLIRINSTVLGGWLRSKISAGQSGGVSLLRQLGSFQGQLFLNFWYFFIHKLNRFPQSKIICVFWCSFCSFTVHACLCVSVTYLHVCLHIQLYLVCPCWLFVQDLYMLLPMLVCICLHLCVFVFTIPCECLCINCRTTRTLQQSQTVFKIFLSKEKVFH